ncbi:MAG: hydantoinase B/oxoprolinase family protein, partial [Thermodesulfobacteriota bacterium]|nr:hydantoinase B/oxoprolinase family protein [Thermodesulfobacteriota bacterium]
ELRKDVICFLERATRSPAMIILDTKARNASCYAIQKGFLELVQRYGRDTVLLVFDRLISESEVLARKKLEKLPDGVWSQEVFVDHDGHDYSVNRIRCTMTKEGDHITFDFTGTSVQTSGSANCAWHGAMGSLFVALAGLLFWDVPWNKGMVAPVTTVFPEGSLINCHFPASSAQCPLSPGIPITNAAWVCISKMLAATDEFRGDLNAAWATGSCGLSYGGIDQYGTRTGSMLMDPFASGCGAGYDRDGVDSGGLQMTPESDCADVETYEAAGPLLYLFRKHRMDGSGPGKFRGGAGLELAHMVHNTPGLYLSERGIGDKITPTVGLWGGYPSCSAVQVLLEDGDAVLEALGQGNVPWTIEECLEMKGAKKMPLYYGMMATEGMTGVLHTGGGAGYGDPVEREPERVRQDVESFIHSVGVAEEVYGVILDRGTFEIDWEKTEKRRVQIKKARIERGKKIA